MIDFNDPRLTLQQKQHILSALAHGRRIVQTSASRAAESNISFGSYWIIKMRDLWHLNKAGEEKLKTLFILNQEKIEKYFPDFSVILLESDRIEKGEWDNFESKWASVGYQHTLVIGCIGLIETVSDQGLMLAKCDFVDEHISDFPYTETLEMIKSDQDMFSIGLLDVPLDDLAKFEPLRHYERLSNFGNVYTATMKSVLNNIRATSRFSKSYRKNKQKRGFGH